MTPNFSFYYTLYEIKLTKNIIIIYIYYFYILYKFGRRQQTDFEFFLNDIGCKERERSS